MKFFKYLLFFLFITSFSGFAQQFRFKTTQMTVLEKDNKNNWGKWSTPEKTEMFVTLDYDKDKIVIYSREIQQERILYKAKKYQRSWQGSRTLLLGEISCKERTILHSGYW